MNITSNDIKYMILQELGRMDLPDFVASDENDVRLVNQRYEYLYSLSLQMYNWNFCKFIEKLSEPFDLKPKIEAEPPQEEEEEKIPEEIPPVDEEETEITPPIEGEENTEQEEENEEEESPDEGGEIPIPDDEDFIEEINPELPEYEEEAYYGKYKYRYDIPDRCLFIRKRYMRYANEQLSGEVYDYEIIGNHLYCDYPELWIEYTGKLAESELPAPFIDFLKYFVASELCHTLTGDNNLLQYLIAKKESAFKQAKNTDLRQGPVKSLKPYAYTSVRY